ncbi:MAG: GNAT family N-acetyltransferase [Chloroflexota bacterium]|jgi:ribosomal-protein-alanine N-acetyltransferase
MFSVRFSQLNIRLVTPAEIPHARDFIRRARFRIIQFGNTTLNLPLDDYIIAGAWHQHHLMAVLVATRVHGDIAWVRACALDSITIADHDRTMRSLAAHLIQHAPVTHLFYSGDHFDAWLADLLKAEGFVAHGDIIAFTTTPIDIQPTSGVALIRPLVPSDIHTIRRIDQAVFEMHWQKSPFEVQELFQSSGIKIAAMVDDHIAGYAIALWHDQQTTLHLVRIAVHPDYQRRGIARQLLTNVMHHGYTQHAQRITLNTQHDNLAAHALYTHHGFRMTGEVYHVIRAATLSA